ncbi:MAG TPA: MarR family transcriptional regulator [Conexibacter sp.]|nr:MarR family transcriptional regulator [Conexibacter sp.]
MHSIAEDYVDLVLPVLLAEARRTYTRAIREALAGAGFDDMPRAGARVIGRIARGGTSVGEVAGAYGVSKQAASQLVDALVMRGYVERVPDDEDRRRMTVALTGRGQAAAVELREAVERVDAQLATAVGADTLRAMRTALASLAAIGVGADPAEIAAASRPA